MMYKRILDSLLESMIELGQKLLELDGIGIDALIINFIVVSLQKIRIKISTIIA